MIGFQISYLIVHCTHNNEQFGDCFIKIKHIFTGILTKAFISQCHLNLQFFPWMLVFKPLALIHLYLVIT